MIKIANNVHQLEEAIDKLPIRQQARLAERLIRTTRKYRFQKLRSSIRAKTKNHPITQKQLNAIVEEAREEFHAQDSR